MLQIYYCYVTQEEEDEDVKKKKDKKSKDKKDKNKDKDKKDKDKDKKDKAKKEEDKKNKNKEEEEEDEDEDEKDEKDKKEEENKGDNNKKQEEEEKKPVKKVIFWIFGLFFTVKKTCTSVSSGKKCCLEMVSYVDIRDRLLIFIISKCNINNKCVTHVRLIYLNGNLLLISKHMHLIGTMMMFIHLFEIQI